MEITIFSKSTRLLIKLSNNSCCSNFLKNTYSSNKLKIQPKQQSKSSQMRLVSLMVQNNFNKSEDFYATLGVTPFATKDVIKKAYKRLALKYHPNVCEGDDCSTKFQQVQYAYEALVKFNEFHKLNQSEDAYEKDDEWDNKLDDEWDEFVEWMGWEGAGTYDFSHNVNDDNIDS